VAGVLAYLAPGYGEEVLRLGKRASPGFCLPTAEAYKRLRWDPTESEKTPPTGQPISEALAKGCFPVILRSSRFV